MKLRSEVLMLQVGRQHAVFNNKYTLIFQFYLADYLFICFVVGEKTGSARGKHTIIRSFLQDLPTYGL